MVKPLQQLKPPQLKQVRLQPTKLRQISVEALRIPLSKLQLGDGKSILSLPYLIAASGLVFATVLAAQFAASPLARASKAAAFQDSLWQANGVVRQSIVGLYRAERVLLPLPTGATPPQAAANPAAPGAAVPPSAASASAPAAAARPAAAATPIAAAAAPPVPAPQAAVNPGSTIDTNLEMRVAIARNASSLSVGVSTAGYLMDLNGQNYCNIPAQTSYVARPTGQGIDFGNCQLGTAVWLESAEGGYIYINDTWFKGRVLLLNDGGNLLAVNYVLMHDYLSSVVGTEMFVNWPIEALKAQAIAARSYALTHHVRPASRHFDLDNTERFQAYKGIAKETNTTQIAVAETSGEFISYNGGIVESLYAASDQIVQEAHGGQGMSQTGAMQLASQGYNYTQILANYYPGTGLSRLVIE
ncbi:SpoIID/LytB domain-containing protein [Pseudanabaena sp. FACHB-2040]|uniref:SpoIID/LytB domain-containing protein n=1 Tax=Pseudanabaena sp. FACHB-2040 TaxID=2692859 RepID=UPI0016874858|nr:SpoIID/LytB domain-containing protein [Pseudanabaena sp. FACHB-2040]MBD2259049.1 SpoIID/LytB domain-containing protein [Pseudanabaena sp. FACHB-2040]